MKRSRNDEENKAAVPFLNKLLEMLNDESNSKFISWNDDGTTIVVHDMFGFQKDVLPNYFKHSNFPSFARQLNFYGFTKTRTDPEWREFINPQFRKDRPDLYHLIKRKTKEEKQVKPTRKSNNNSIPDPHDEEETKFESMWDDDFDGGDMFLNNEGQQMLLDENTLFAPKSAARVKPALKRGREQSDNIMTELVALNQRLVKVEDQSSILKRENSLLWNELLQSRERQTMMRQRMKKIMFYVYQLYAGAAKRGMLAPGEGVKFSKMQTEGMVESGKDDREMLQLTNVSNVAIPNSPELLASDHFAADGSLTPLQLNSVIEILSKDGDDEGSRTIKAPWPTSNVKPAVHRTNTEEWFTDYLQGGDVTLSPEKKSKVEVLKKPEQLDELGRQLTADEKQVASKIDSMETDLSSTFGDFDHLLSDMPLFSGFELPENISPTKNNNKKRKVM